jgi:hypothetical protein
MRAIDRRRMLTVSASLPLAASASFAQEKTKPKGNLKQSIVFWCFNVAGEKWDVNKTCEVAKSLGCASVELVGPDDWPTLKKHGLTCAIAPNGMPGAPFMKGVNNPKYQNFNIAVGLTHASHCASVMLASLRLASVQGKRPRPACPEPPQKRPAPPPAPRPLLSVKRQE